MLSENQQMAMVLIAGIFLVVVLLIAAFVYFPPGGSFEDGFEDGDYTNPLWNIYLGTAIVQQDVVKFGSYALRVDEAIAKTRKESPISVYGTWINLTNANYGSYFQISGEGRLIQRIRVVGNKFTAYDGQSIITINRTGLTALTNTWYYFEIGYTDNSETSVVSVYGSDGEIIFSETLEPYSVGAVDFISVSSDTTAYFDSVVR